MSFFPLESQNQSVPQEIISTPPMLSLRTKITILFFAHEQSFPYVLNDAVLESHFLQETGNVIVFHMN